MALKCSEVMEVDWAGFPLRRIFFSRHPSVVEDRILNQLINEILRTKNRKAEACVEEFLCIRRDLGTLDDCLETDH